MLLDLLTCRSALKLIYFFDLPRLRIMAFEETPNKRPKLDSGYATSPEPSPMKFPSAGQANNAVVLYDPVPMRKDPAR